MLHALGFPQAVSVAPLFAGLEEHLVLASIFAGKSPATVYVDDRSLPSAAFIWYKHRAFLGGSPRNQGFLNETGELLNSELIPAALAQGVEAMLLHFYDPAWQTELAALLPSHTPILGRRQYFQIDIDPSTDPQFFVGGPLPDGFEALPVDVDLLSRDELGNIDLLRAETCSERLSVEDFLTYSFGSCLVKQEHLAAWCLSEYNVDGRCEVGVATMEAYQRQGLGTLVTRRFLAQAREAGYDQVGWHCWANNEASGALARRAGFRLHKESFVHLYLLGDRS